MKLDRRLVSPDEKLVLVVRMGCDGETAVGFEGGAWHTHPGLLAAWLSVDEAVAVDVFISKLQADELPVIWSTDAGVTVDPWVSDNLPATSAAHGRESCLLRFWSKSEVKSASGYAAL